MADILATESMQWNRSIHTDILREADGELAVMMDAREIDPVAVERVRERLQRVMAEMQETEAPS